MVNGITGVGSSMSTEMIKNMRAKMFSKVDTDSNGSVDQTEFDVMTAHLAEKTGETLDSTSLFSETDTDKSGTLSQDELGTFAEAHRPEGGPPPMPFMPEQIEQMRQDIFSRMDTNNDESISKNEFDSALQAADDENSSGSEDSSSSNSFFDKIDTNQDGTISTEEMDAYLKSQGMGPQSADTTDGELFSTLMDILQKNNEDQNSESDTSSGITGNTANTAAAYKSIDIVI